MRKLTVLGAAIGALAFAGAAGAAQPIHTKDNPAIGPFDYPAGTLCDFHYYETDTVEVNELDYANGEIRAHISVTVVHTNVDTGYTVTDTDQYTQIIYPDGTQKLVGLFWHIRDPTGKLVLVKAGQMTFDTNGVPTGFTPNTDPDFAAVVCSALGGHPA